MEGSSSKALSLSPHAKYFIPGQSALSADFFTTMKAAATYPLVFRFHLYMMHHTHTTNTLAHFNPREGKNLPNLKTIEKILRKPTERNTRLYILGIIRLAFAIVD